MFNDISFTFFFLFIKTKHVTKRQRRKAVHDTGIPNIQGSNKYYWNGAKNESTIN